jgi:hypothetical protein
MQPKKYLATALLFLALLSCANAATFYVSPSGSGMHNGSSEPSAFSLSEAKSYANSHASEEITFMLLPGNYGVFSEITDRNAWVAWKGSKASVFTSISLGAYPNAHDLHIRFEGIAVNHGQPLPSSGTAIKLYKVKNVEFSGIDVIGNGFDYDDGTSAIYFSDSNNIEINDCKIYGSGDGPKSGFSNGIYGRSSSHISIENCEITETTEGLIAWGRDWVIRGNHLHHLNADGILGTDLADALIENNTVNDVEHPPETGYHCDCLQLFNVNPAAGPGTIHMKNITIRNNTMYRSDGQITLWNHFHYLPENIVFENNLLYGSRTTAAEFHVSETDNLIFRNNTVIGNVIFRGNEFSSTVSSNIMFLYGPVISEGVVINSESNNIIKQFTSWTVPAGSSYKLSEDTIQLDEAAFNAMFVNAPVFGDSVSYKSADYNATIGETTLNGKVYSTFTVPEINFNELAVYPKYNITAKGGGDAFTCYDPGTSSYNCADLFILKTEGNTITLMKDITNVSGRTVTIGVYYGKSTKTRIHVNDNAKYNVGDVIDYDFDEIAHTITNKGTDDFGKFIEVDVPLQEEARARKKLNNWGQGHTNVHRDYTPLQSSQACPNGNSNLSPAEYIGSKACEGTAPTECVGTDTSCGTYPNCANCNSQDGCDGNILRDYHCTGTSCTFTEDDCSDCSCTCGDYNATESIANNNCSDGKDNDCDTKTDTADEGCKTTECIDNTKLTDYISQWKQGSITLLALMQKMKQWKTGAGCTQS